MIRKLTELEKHVGGRIEYPDERTIPGLERQRDTTVYFEVPSDQVFKTVFSKITRFQDPPLMRSGGVVQAGCTIETPDGTVFHAIIINANANGDVKGWQAQISAGAKALGYRLAGFKSQNFTTDDGREYNVAECTVTFH